MAEWLEGVRKTLEKDGYVPQRNREYNLTLKTGETLGKVSGEALKRLKRGDIDVYLPKNNDEAKVIEKFIYSNGNAGKSFAQNNSKQTAYNQAYNSAIKEYLSKSNKNETIRPSDSVKRTTKAGSIAKEVYGGLAEFSKGLYESADWIRNSLRVNDLKKEMYEDFGRDFGVPEPKDTIGEYIKYGKNNMDNIIRDVQEREKAHNINPTAGSLMRSTVAAVPQAAAAIATSGQSVAAEGAKLLQDTRYIPKLTAILSGGSKTEAASASASLILNQAKEMLKNPSFWTSFISTAGGDYQEAKENGMTETQANAYALINSLTNAGIEIGGGLEELAKKQNGGSVKDTIFDLVKSSFEEGSEEVKQGLVSNINKSAFKGEMPELYSNENEDAVINPSRMGMEFLGGATVGAVLGAGTQGINYALGKSARNAETNNSKRIDIQNKTDTNINEDLVQKVNKPQTQKNVQGEKSKNIKTTQQTETNTNSNIDTKLSPVGSVPYNEEVRSFGEKLGERGKKFLYSRYKGQEDFVAYKTAFEGYYNAGSTGMDFEKFNSRVSENLKSVIPEPYAKTIYELGEKDNAAKVEALNRKINKVVGFDNEAGFIEDKNAFGVDKNDKKVLEAVSQTLGVKTKFEESVFGGAANGSYKNGVIRIARDAENPFLTVFSHEMGHRLRETAPSDYKAISSFVAQDIENGERTFSQTVEMYQRTAEKSGVNLSYDEAVEEITNDYISKIINTPEKLQSLVAKAKEGTLDTSKSKAENINIVKRFANAISEFIKKIKTALKGGKISSQKANAEISSAEKAAELIQKAFNTSVENVNKSVQTSTKSVNSSTQDTKLSIKFTNDNNPVVVVEDDILKDVPKNEWTKTVKNEIKKFSDGIPVSGRLIKVNRVTQNEFTNSRYSNYLRDNLNNVYVDKLNSAGNLDEIVLASTNYVNEDLNHKRKDNIKQFARGDVLLKVGENQYKANVIVGFTNNNELLLYDVVNISNEDFEIKNAAEPYGEFENQTSIRSGSTASDNNISQSDTAVKDNFTQNSEKYSLKSEEDEKTAKKNAKVAEENFGTTDNFDVAGYLTVNGKMLDFSGKHWGATNSNIRQVDHADISEVEGITYYVNNDLSGADAVQRFIDDGNIRILPENNAINLSVMPNNEQIDVLYDYISEKNGEITVDITNINGRTEQTFEYGKGTSAKKVINDLKTYFSTGEVPQISDFGKFRYSLKETAEIQNEQQKLEEENQKLKENVKKLQKEVSEKQKFIDVRVKNSKDFANRLKSEFSADINTEVLQKDLEGLTELASMVVNRKASFESLKNGAQEIAGRILESSAQLDSEAYEQYKELTGYLRGAKIAVDEDTKAEFGDEWKMFRQKNFGRMGLANSGVGIDVVYQELTRNYPEFFDIEKQRGGKKRLKHIESVLDSLKNVFENPFEGYMTEAKEWLGASITDSIFKDLTIDPKKTVDGKMTVEIDLKNLKNIHHETTNKLIVKQNEWKARQLEKIQKQYSERFERRTERQNKNLKMKQIRLHTEKISKMLLKPTNTSNVPEFLRPAVADFLSSFDIKSDRMSEKTVGNLDHLALLYDKIANAPTDNSLVVDPDLVANIEALAGSVKSLNTDKISEMSLSELESLYRVSLTVERSIQSYNKIFRDEKAHEISKLGKKLVEENQTKKGYNTSKINTVQKTKDMLNIEMLNPWDFFHRLGTTAEELYTELGVKGRNKFMNRLNVAKEYLEPIIKEFDYKNASKKNSLTKFELSTGESIDLTPAEVMSLYLTAKQEAGVNHITGGGIRKNSEIVKERKLLGKKTKKGYGVVHFNASDIEKVTSSLSAEQKEIADKIGNFLSTTCAEWGNEVSMELYGYKKFGTKHYFPIVSDPNYLNSDYSASADVKLENTGITKARVKNAKNPIIIGDVFDVAVKHIDKMANYSAFTVPLKNIERVFNYKNKDGSVWETIERKFGKGAVKYYKNFMNDVNKGGKHEGNGAVMDKAISNYKSAKMGFNLRVAMQQPTSITRAGALISDKYLLKAVVTKTDIETIYKYAPIARWKSWGFFSLDTGKDMQGLILGEKQMSDYTMFLAEKGDEWTWKRIWAAVEAETKAEHKELSPGTEAFYKHCGERFTEIIDRTQVVDSTFHRSGVLRDKNALTKMATAFMSEPIKTFNLYSTAFSDAFKAHDTKEAKRIAGKALRRIAAHCIVSNIGTAFTAGLYDTIRKRGDEEDDNPFLKKWIKNSALRRWIENSAENFVNDQFGLIPIIKDLISIVQGNEIKRMDMQGYADLYNAFQRAASGKYTTAYTIIDIAAKGADLFGVPATILRREICDVFAKNIIDLTGDYKLGFEAKKLEYRISSMGNKGEYFDYLYKVLTGDKGTESEREQAYKEIYDELVANGYKPSEINSGLDSRIKKHIINGIPPKTLDVPYDYDIDFVSEEPEKTYTINDLSTEQLHSYNKQYTTMEHNLEANLQPYIKSLSEVDKTKVKKQLHTYVHEKALSDNSGGKYKLDGTANKEEGEFDGKKWILHAQNSEKNLGIPTAKFIYLSAFYSMATLTSDSAVTAVKMGIDIETYLKYKQGVNNAGKTKKADKKDYVSGMDISSSDKKKLKQFITQEGKKK